MKERNGQSIIWKLVKALFKLAFKIFILLMWGCLRIIEIILQHVNNYLKKIIN